jgi:hypothetical protein
MPKFWNKIIYLVIVVQLVVAHPKHTVDETDQQEAMQALAENFEMTESFTIWKLEDETSMQLFQI